MFLMRVESRLVIQLCIYVLTIIFRLESRTKEKRNTFTNSDRKRDTQAQSLPTIIARRFASFLTVSQFRDGIFAFSPDIISRFSIKSDPNYRDPRDCNFQEWWQAGLLLRRRETSCFVKIALATPEPEVGSEGQRRTWGVRRREGNENSTREKERTREGMRERKRVSRRQYKGAIKSRRPTIRADLAHRLHLILSAFSTSLPFTRPVGIGGCAT